MFPIIVLLAVADRINEFAAPTKERRDPTLALADGMKFLLRFGDDRSAVSAPAALAGYG